jgi:hypothetical protein
MMGRIEALTVEFDWVSHRASSKHKRDIAAFLYDIQLSKKCIDSSLDAPQLPQELGLTSCRVRLSDRSLLEMLSALIGNSVSLTMID